MNHSTETAILNICDNILHNMENNTNTTMVALDLSAAFDTVNHKILLEVLNNSENHTKMDQIISDKQTVSCTN